MTEIECFVRGGVLLNGRRVELRFAKIDGQLVCIGMEIGPKLVDAEKFVNVKAEDLRPLRAKEIRSIRLGQFREIVLGSAVLVRTPSGDPEKLYDELVAMHADAEFARAAASEKPGRPPLYGREHFEKVARVYQEHLAAGGRAPTKAVGDHFKTTKSTAAKWVARARSDEFGLLPAYHQEER